MKELKLTDTFCIYSCSVLNPLAGFHLQHVTLPRVVLYILVGRNKNNSAVHRSRRAGVCSPPAKTPEALICAANYHCTSAKEFMIDNYGILYYFVYHCGVCKTIGRV